MNLLTTSALLSALVLVGCSSEPQPEVANDGSSAMPVGDPHAPAAPTSISGAVVETMNSGGYTYALIDTGADKLWAAGPETSAKVGDVVSASGLMTMYEFESKTLERTFDVIYFAAQLRNADVSAFHAGIESSAEEIAPVSTDIEPAQGGQTVADIFEKREQLVGQEVLIRAEVVKFNADIMKTNWIHIQDGSGSKGTNDLTVTTSASLAVGDQVVVRGVLIADKDFGYGYKYDLIIEDATVTKQ